MLPLSVSAAGQNETHGQPPETVFDSDIRQVTERGLVAYCSEIIKIRLPDSFWSSTLPQYMNVSSTKSPYFLAWQAAQVKFNDKGFLSRDITVQDLILNRSDVHHIYPKNCLQKQKFTRGHYNQIANFVLTQSKINITIGKKPPHQYFAGLAAQVRGGVKQYGGITGETELRANLQGNCIPESLLDGHIPDYEQFLEQRRRLMALKIKSWFERL